MRKSFAGFSLVEMLVVISIFSVVAVISTKSLADSLRSSNKSENIGNVKNSLGHSLSAMERLLRNAQSITCNPTPSGDELIYTDEYGEETNFLCDLDGTSGRIASGSAGFWLTGDRVSINDGCSGATPVFTCIPGDPTNNIPPSVEINLIGNDITTSGAGSARATAKTRIQLRNY